MSLLAAESVVVGVEVVGVASGDVIDDAGRGVVRPVAGSAGTVVVRSPVVHEAWGVAGRAVSAAAAAGAAAATTTPTAARRRRRRQHLLGVDLVPLAGDGLAVGGGDDPYPVVGVWRDQLALVVAAAPVQDVAPEVESGADGVLEDRAALVSDLELHAGDLVQDKGHIQLVGDVIEFERRKRQRGELHQPRAEMGLHRDSLTGQKRAGQVVAQCKDVGAGLGCRGQLAGDLGLAGGCLACA